MRVSMQRTHLLASLVLVVMSTTAIFAGAEENASAREAPSCGEWVAHREKSTTLALGDAGWLRGYLAGIEAGSRGNYLSRIDNASIYRWMDGYCRSNPLRDVSAGAKLLAAELASGKRSSPK